MSATATGYKTKTVTRSKGERTRTEILEAATRMFAEKGYDGTGIREIESAAGVNRGVVTYHFGNKEEVWKAMFAFAFIPFLDDLRSKVELLRALDPRTRTRFLVENFVRTSAARPYMNRLMVQENFTESWRSDWIIKNFLEPIRELNTLIADDDLFLNHMEFDPHIRYAILGACNTVFSHRCEVKSLFNQDVGDEPFIDQHVVSILELVDALLAQKQSEKEQNHV